MYLTNLSLFVFRLLRLQDQSSLVLLTHFSTVERTNAPRPQAAHVPVRTVSVPMPQCRFQTQRYFPLLMRLPLRHPFFRRVGPVAGLFGTWSQLAGLFADHEHPFPRMLANPVILRLYFPTSRSRSMPFLVFVPVGALRPHSCTIIKGFRETSCDI